MKRFDKILALFLALTILFSLASVSFAAEGVKEVKMLCYNVAGLPSISGIMGQQGTDVGSNQTKLGHHLNASGYDVIAVQEDFNYHCNLVRGLTSYRYKTDHTGGVPGGDGMNIFSKFPIYNAKRFPWNKACGVFNDGDELTPKGILYSVLDLGNGIYVDLYDIHADAFGDAGSVNARNDNFRQLYSLIKSKNSKRPVIITGDFNTSTHLSDGGVFTDYLINQSGFLDAWTELYNGSDYSNYSGHSGSYWGEWDSVEKFLYRDGGGVHVEAKSFEYKDFLNNGVSISDHKAASVVFRFTKTDNFVKNSERLIVTHNNPFAMAANKIRVTITDLGKIFANIDDLIALIK